MILQSSETFVPYYVISGVFSRNKTISDKIDLFCFDLFLPLWFFFAGCYNYTVKKFKDEDCTTIDVTEWTKTIDRLPLIGVTVKNIFKLFFIQNVMSLS